MRNPREPRKLVSRRWAMRSRSACGGSVWASKATRSPLTSKWSVHKGAARHAPETCEGACAGRRPGSADTDVVGHVRSISRLGDLLNELARLLVPQRLNKVSLGEHAHQAI